MDTGFPWTLRCGSRCKSKQADAGDARFGNASYGSGDGLA